MDSTGSEARSRWMTALRTVQPRHLCALIVQLLLVPGCTAEPSDVGRTVEECPMGGIRACTGPDRCAGEKRCEGPPPHWGACICPAKPERDARAPAELGAPCRADAECSAPAFCLTSNRASVFGGRSAVGTCVADCTDDAAACEEFASAVCVDVSPAPAFDGNAPGGDGGLLRPSALCFERCELGSDPEKCHGTRGVACDALDGTGKSTGFCRPLCITSADCETGTCDLRYGVCREADSGRGSPMGTPCDPDAPENDCDGLCVSLSLSHAVCSHRCTFGDFRDCADPGGGERIAGCVFAPRAGGVGDVGYCAPLCDCNQDCKRSSELCDGFESTALERAFGRAGVCTNPELAVGASIDCAP